jgi:ATP-dependent Clp protease ATP-binding subunit ClpB
MSPATNDVLQKAFDEAGAFKDEYVSTEHLFLAIAGLYKDPAAAVLKRHGATREAILQALAAVRGSHRVTSQNPESTFRALEQYARDLTELARRGKLDPVIGRDDEIRRVMQILARRRATWDTNRAVSSPNRCVGGRIRSSSSMKSRRPIPTYPM